MLQRVYLGRGRLVTHFLNSGDEESSNIMWKGGKVYLFENPDKNIFYLKGEKNENAILQKDFQIRCDDYCFCYHILRAIGDNNAGLF
jgi:hypothetical protein